MIFNKVPCRQLGNFEHFTRLIILLPQNALVVEGSFEFLVQLLGRFQLVEVHLAKRLRVNFNSKTPLGSFEMLTNLV